MRPGLLRNHSSPSDSRPSSGATSPPPLPSPGLSNPNTRVSIAPLPKLEVATSSRPNLTHSPASALASTTSSGLGAGAGSSAGGLSMRRTITSESSEGRYRRKVGFEAFESGESALFAFTAQAKSEGYKRSRNTRVFAVAVSPDESGEDALVWLMNELVEDGDEVVAIRVIELAEGEKANPTNQDEVREDAQTLLARVLERNNAVDDERRISAIVEVVVGRVEKMLLKMIALYRPDSLVVGTRGARSRFQKMGMALGAPGMGSVSRFAVSHSPVPVIVVRPNRKVKKTLAKRQNDPKRGQYAALVGAEGLSLSRSRSRGSIASRGSISGMSDVER